MKILKQSARQEKISNDANLKNTRIKKPTIIGLSQDRKTIILPLKNGCKLSFERKDGDEVSSDEMKKIMDIVSKYDFDVRKDLKESLGGNYNLKSFTGNGKLSLNTKLDSQLFGMNFASDFKLENIMIKENCGIIFSGEKLTLNNIKFEKKSGLHVKNAKDVVIRNCEFPLHVDSNGKVTNNAYAFMISGLSEALTIEDSRGMINQSLFKLRKDGKRGNISFRKTQEDGSKINLAPQDIIDDFRGSLFKKGYVAGLGDCILERKKETLNKNIESINPIIKREEKKLIKLHKWIIKEDGIKEKLKGILSLVTQKKKQFERTKSRLINLENKRRYNKAILRSDGYYDKVHNLEIKEGKINYISKLEHAPKADSLLKPNLEKIAKNLATIFNFACKFSSSDEGFFKTTKEKIFKKLYKDESKNNENAKIYKSCCDGIRSFFKDVVSIFNEEYEGYKKNLNNK